MKGLKIASTFYRHYKIVKNFNHLTDRKKNNFSAPDKLTEDLISFGPLYIKLGQILSTRPDVMPQTYVQALEKLHENVPPFDYSKVCQTIEKGLGKALQKIFRSFDEKPVASASLAQVHYAVLHTGEEVAVKIQRPRAAESIHKDLKLLERILHLLKILFPDKIRKANLIEGFREFKRYTLQELDFAHEANTIEKFSTNFKGWDDILFPEIYWEFTGKKILTMQRLSGMRLHEALIKLPKEVKERINTRLVEMELKMFITDGLFHADLHPGNILFREDEKIALLDFGMYGELNKEERDRFVLYWMEVSENRVNKAFYHFRKQCRELPGANERAFYDRFKVLADQFYHNHLRDTSITKVYMNMIHAGYQYGYIFPGHLLLHAKAITTAEALTFELAPDARFEEITRPLILREFTAQVFNGKKLQSRIEQQLPELLLTGNFPEVMIDNEEDGNITGDFRAALFEQLIQNINKWTAHGKIFKQILDAPSRTFLQEHFSASEIERILQTTWKQFQHLESSLPEQKSLGANFTIRLAAATISLYHALLSIDKKKEQAIQLIYDIGWKVYKKMADIPMLIAGGLSDDRFNRMVIASRIFRMFPFSEPDYVWKDIASDHGTVAFNCTRCHVAELFKKHELSDVCYHTWCKLDFPLAAYWGGRLERTNSIAGGARICDFRFVAKSKN